MKSKKMKQGMSWLLCMVMLLGNNVTVLAEEAETGKEGQTQTDAQKVSAQEMEDSQQETQTSEIQETQETENTAEQTEAEPEEEPVYNEAVQLRHEFYDEAGNVISAVTADIQEGSFEADASAISMEADTLTAEEDAYMQGLIKENLPEDTYLGDYVLYDVVFKVNGELTDPKKEIKLTCEGTGINVQNVQDAFAQFLPFGIFDTQRYQFAVIEFSNVILGHQVMGFFDIELPCQQEVMQAAAERVKRTILKDGLYPPKK